MSQRLHVNQATDVRRATVLRYAVRSTTVEEEFVLEGLAAAATMHEQVFQLGQAA